MENNTDINKKQLIEEGAQQVLDFWFKELTPAQWWQKSDALDQLISQRFSKLHQQAQLGELFSWRETALGRLAEVIILDQFSRNIYRDSAKAFASDAQALCLAQEAVRQKADQALNQTQRSFLYMPYMHSESLAVHDIALVLFKENGNENNYQFEIKHRDIIAEFGRYPHRNQILGRESSQEELAFLQQPGSSF